MHRLFVFRRLEQRSERAILDSEVSDARRLANVLSVRVVSLQTSLRRGAARLALTNLEDPRALLAYLEERAVLRSMFDSLLCAPGTVASYAWVTPAPANGQQVARALEHWMLALVHLIQGP